MIIKYIYYILFLITVGYSLYFVNIGINGLIKKDKKTKKKEGKYNYFAILVAARNEETTIGNLLDSLNKLKYPKDKYTIYVIPNNCTDNTKEVALKYNVNILDCKVKTKIKSDVLKYSFEALKKDTKIDAYVIFDADNIVDENFLTHMNDSLNQGYNVAQGYREAKNPCDNWISGSYTIFYLYQNLFFNSSRKKKKLSPSINGTGFMIKKEFIDSLGFNTKTLTEDIEFTGICAMNQEKIDFVDNAITYDEYPITFKDSWIQRKRWTSGAIECSKIYSYKLFINYLKNKNIESLDISLMYLAPIIQTLNFLDVILLFILKYLNTANTSYYISSLIFLIFTYLIGIVLEIIVLKHKNKPISKMISAILLFPIFILSWIPIDIICLIKKQTGWQEIKHTRDINITEITK